MDKGLDELRRVWVYNNQKEIRKLAKFFLELLEDLKSDQDSNLEKLSTLMKEEFHPILPFLEVIDDKKFGQLRKRILDKSNDIIREMEK